MLAVAVVALAGCAAVADLGAQRATGPDPIGFPECMDESYDFAGTSTLAALGLQDHVPAELPEPGRPAMIWVTHDLRRYDAGPQGGPIQMTRMLCFEFVDGNGEGGSEWPVDAAWQPPGLAPSAAQGESPGTLVPVAIAVTLALIALVGVSFVAFRGRQS